MKSLMCSRNIIWLLSAILFVMPFLVVKLNMLARDFIYSGSVRDALGMGTVDLVELRAEGKTTYTDKDGKFSLLITHPLFWGLLKEANAPVIEAIPTSDYEGSSIKVPCVLVTASFLSNQVDCPVLVYPTVVTVASRVLATEISQGLFSAPEIAARKSGLWDLLSEESKQQWKNKDEFVGTLVSQETDRVKVKSQPNSFLVSPTEKLYSEYIYLGKISVNGEIASVDASVTVGSGKVNNVSLYFVKKDNIWRYLIPDRRNGGFL